MTKEVMISIRGIQFEEGLDGEKIESIQKGEYYNRNDMHYILFEEIVEGMDDPVKSMIKFKEGEMHLNKKGPINVTMDFLEDKKTLTDYRTPFGSLVIGLEAKKVNFEEEEKRILLDVDYTLEVNYEPLANCKIRVDIRSMDGEAFSLRS
ncbi:MAG: DUF1934 domain-containing protein [Lachnospiraceae bacterium]|nr:DUF1934 domain-containing protein [Lachnospiraceae bacterium]